MTGFKALIFVFFPGELLDNYLLSPLTPPSLSPSEMWRRKKVLKSVQNEASTSDQFASQQSLFAERLTSLDFIQTRQLSICNSGFPTAVPISELVQGQGPTSVTWLALPICFGSWTPPCSCETLWMKPGSQLYFLDEFQSQRNSNFWHIILNQRIPNTCGTVLGVERQVCPTYVVSWHIW